MIGDWKTTVMGMASYPWYNTTWEALLSQTFTVTSTRRGWPCKSLESTNKYCLMPADTRPQLSYSFLLKLQQYQCFYCTKKLDTVGHCKSHPHGYTRDHFFPRSMGNPLTGNMVLSCAKCNRKKDDHMPTPDEVVRFNELWSHIQGGPSIDLSEFFYTQRLINYLCKLVGPPLYRRNII